MITVDDAKLQAAALRTASEASPLRQYRAELHRRAVEWERACRDCDDDTLVIELAGSVAPGMEVPIINTRGEGAWGTVIRVLLRDGQTSLHVQDDVGRDQYLNFATTSSPVVVKA